MKLILKQQSSGSGSKTELILVDSRNARVGKPIVTFGQLTDQKFEESQERLDNWRAMIERHAREDELNQAIAIVRAAYPGSNPVVALLQDRIKVVRRIGFDTPADD